MTWDAEDSKYYTGRLDRIYVSPSESWDVNHFIKHYLLSHRRLDTDINRTTVGKILEQYPAHAPWSRVHLVALVEQYSC